MSIGLSPVALLRLHSAFLVVGAVASIAIMLVLSSLDHGDDLEMLIVFADEAMYRAKATGRNRVASFYGARSPGTLLQPD